MFSESSYLRIELEKTVGVAALNAGFLSSRLKGMRKTSGNWSFRNSK